MDRESTAAIISDVERAVNFIDRFADPDIYRLLDELKIAFREKDEEAIRKKAGRSWITDVTPPSLRRRIAC